MKLLLLVFFISTAVFAKSKTSPAPDLEKLAENCLQKKSKKDCLTAAQMAHNNGGRKRAQELWHQGCELKSAEACLAEGELIAGDGNYELAAAPLMDACDAKLTAACFKAGQLFEEKNLYVRARQPYSQACLKKFPGSCDALKRVQADAPVPKDHNF